MYQLKKRINNLINHIYNTNIIIPFAIKPNIFIENKYINNMLSNLINKQYFRNIQNENVKILTIMACHANTEEKYLTAVNNFSYLQSFNNDIIVINSINEAYSENLKNDLNEKSKIYFEVKNNMHFDIGKFIHVCKNVDTSAYDFVVFINDSFFITGSIFPFYNLMIERNVELYGFTSSTELKHHYQSFLYGIKSNYIPKFIELYESKKHLFTSHHNVIMQFEIHFADLFTNKDCYLSLENYPTNKGLNIFFHNDLLYAKLIRSRLLPIIKLRRFAEEAAEGNFF